MKKKVVILYSPDKYANGVKPRQLKKYLSSRNCDVTMFPTDLLSRRGNGKISKWLPKLTVNTVLLYCMENLGIAADLSGLTVAKRFVRSHTIKRVIKLRGKIVNNSLKEQKYDLLINENPLDEGVFLYPKIARKQILDLPAPLAEELFYGHAVTKNAYQKLSTLEKNIYSKADYLSFHWHTYADFVKKEKYNGNNFIELTYGVEEKAKKAQFSHDPKIIFLGYLEGPWVNLPLLEHLCQKYPNIDVYGGPPPTKKYKINYKGYALNTDVLSQYQFGLITITNDPLRKSSFSSKHLEYISFGLPVLTPSWRKDSLLDRTSIYYNEHTFLDSVKKYSKKENWEKLNKYSINYTKKLTWEEALSPLEKILKKI